jgi:hypothetical protein
MVATMTDRRGSASSNSSISIAMMDGGLEAADDDAKGYGGKRMGVKYRAQGQANSSSNQASPFPLNSGTPRARLYRLGRGTHSRRE